MNWLGLLVAARVLPTDEVLDLGCGIMAPTGGRLPCKAHVGVDSFPAYLDRIGPPTILAGVSDVAAGPHLLPPKSFDVVLLLDVVEHLDKPDALTVMAGAEAIARREVVVFTPDGFCPQDGWDAWGLGHNPAQAHCCQFTFDELAALGYACTRHPNGTRQHGPVMAVLGVKSVAGPPPVDRMEYKRALKARESCLAAVQRWEAGRTLSAR